LVLARINHTKNKTAGFLLGVLSFFDQPPRSGDSGNISGRFCDACDF